MQSAILLRHFCLSVRLSNANIMSKRLYAYIVKLFSPSGRDSIVFFSCPNRRYKIPKQTLLAGGGVKYMGWESVFFDGNRRLFRKRQDRGQRMPSIYNRKSQVTDRSVSVSMTVMALKGGTRGARFLGRYSSVCTVDLERPKPNSV